jgi:hypothetical protein
MKSSRWHWKTTGAPDSLSVLDTTSFGDAYPEGWVTVAQKTPHKSV